ncbi:hypothetical protein RND81_14G034300 [Saponaria officinalis]|uniref:Uncharacterized protein n=1 Tax=Saponaria officinalis TaxID=3572 RepID=A0AAW1GPV9_SAPOF
MKIGGKGGGGYMKKMKISKSQSHKKVTVIHLPPWVMYYPDLRVKNYPIGPHPSIIHSSLIIYPISPLCRSLSPLFCALLPRIKYVQSKRAQILIIIQIYFLFHIQILPKLSFRYRTKWVAIILNLAGPFN